MQQTIDLMQTVFQNPPMPYNPVNQTLKGWVVFCLRDRGFKVTTFSPKADFVVEGKQGNLNFKITQDPEAVDASIGWILVDAAGTSAQVIAP
jgi:hypothetical protein